MSYKVIVDSCGELTAEMKASGRFETASLGLEVGDLWKDITVMRSMYMLLRCLLN